jgi:hypothetical protein
MPPVGGEFIVRDGFIFQIDSATKTLDLGENGSIGFDARKDSLELLWNPAASRR